MCLILSTYFDLQNPIELMPITYRNVSSCVDLKSLFGEISFHNFRKSIDMASFLSEFFHAAVMCLFDGIFYCTKKYF